MKQRAFSLVELLFVMAIMGIVAGLVLPAFNTVGKSQGLTNAGSALLDQLASARQAAISQNRVVEVRIYKRREDPTRALNVTSNPERFRSFRTMIRDEAGTNAFVLQPMQELPARMVFSESQAFSTLIFPYTTPSRDYVTLLQKEDLSPTEKNVPYQLIRFKPTGGTDLAASGPIPNEKWFITIKSDNEVETATVPGKNYVTIMLDPVSGRVRTYRP